MLAGTGPGLYGQSTDIGSILFTICQYYLQSTTFETGTRGVGGSKAASPQWEKTEGRDGHGKAVVDGVRCRDGRLEEKRK